MPKIADDATIGTENTTSIVDLDQLFNTLDARTRRGLQQLFHGSYVQFAGKEKLAGEAAHLFAPALSTTARLVNEVGRDNQVLTDTLVQTSRTVTTLAGRRNALTDLITNANITTGAIAAENAAFARDLREIPPTLRQANTTFVDLRATLGDLNTLVSASKPASRRLASFLRVLRPLVARAKPTLHDLRLAISSPGPNNDLVDTMRLLPRFSRETDVAFPLTVKTLKRSQAFLDFTRPYVPELVGWFKDFGQGASWYDANGHYARIQPIFNTFQLSEANTLVPKAVRNPLGGYTALATGTDQLRRCPGAAASVRPDGGNPFVDRGKFSAQPNGCNPKQVLPAP
jgi:phospholipid/cholesterol/gamma-HCH transport system substrate-binding protein